MGTADNIVRPMATTIKNEIANVLDGDRELFWDMPDRAMSKHPPGISCHSVEDATQFIKQNLEKHLDRKSLLSMSAKLANQIEACCGNDSQSMLPSFVNKVPDGTESGEFLCLEIGGSTLRAALVRLYETKGSERQLPKVTGLQSWPITRELKSSKGTTFIRWIAQTTAHMVEESYASLNDRQSSLRACLTWSFPLEQDATDRGRILGGGKGFLVFDELVGCDIGVLLHDAFMEEGISIRLEALVNDTVAGLLAGEYTEPSMRTSVVLGTGLNAATAVPISKIGPFKLLKHNTEFLQAGGDVLVNAELSLLGGTIFLRTLWDDILIENLPSGVCFQPLEYLCSGYYLGEIVRVILVWAVELGCLSPKYMPYQMLQPFSFPSSLVATLASDSTQELSLSAAALVQHLTLLDHQAPTLRELRMIKAVAQSVSVRAAGYMAVAIHALSEFTMTASKSAEDCNEGQSDRTTVGVSGAVFESLPGFKPACEAFLNDMEQGNGEVGGKRKSFTLSHVAHGTMVGSALAAAMCK